MSVLLACRLCTLHAERCDKNIEWRKDFMFWWSTVSTKLEQALSYVHRQLNERCILYHCKFSVWYHREGVQLS